MSTLLVYSAIKKVNVARKALGLRHISRFPQGKKTCSATCPLAIALKADVGSSTVTFSSKRKAARVAKAWQSGANEVKGDYKIALPPALEEFVHEFDRGLIPTLVIPTLVK